MAACNAVFWDGERGRWDGSEDIMVRSRGWISKMPDSNHTPVVSASSLLTVALTLQGVQAIAQIVGIVIPTSSGLADGLPNLFLPLSVLGLMRLPAALWLSSDYGYMNTEEKTDGNVPVDSTKDLVVVQKPELVSDSLLDARSWKGLLYRAFWILSALAVLGPSVVSCSHIWWRPGSGPHVIFTSTSRMLFALMYLVLTAPGLLIICAYVLMGTSNTTVIPCIHSAWYKVFTLLLMVLALITVVIAAVETRILPDGNFTTHPEFDCNPQGGCWPVKGPGNGTAPRR
jgi:hypothetical protein